MEDSGCIKNPKEIVYNTITRECGVCGAPEAGTAGSGITTDENPKPGGDKVDFGRAYKNELVLSRTPLISSSFRPLPKVNLSGQSNVLKVESALENREELSAVTIPRYVTLEPSLAMDWLEISWDELHIKERIGAGTFFLTLIYYWFLFESEKYSNFSVVEATLVSTPFYSISQVHLGQCIVLNGMDR